MIKTLLDDNFVRVTIIPKNIFPPAANRPERENKKNDLRHVIRDCTKTGDKVRALPVCERELGSHRRKVVVGS